MLCTQLSLQTSPPAPPAKIKQDKNALGKPLSGDSTRRIVEWDRGWGGIEILHRGAESTRSACPFVSLGSVLIFGELTVEIETRPSSRAPRESRPSFPTQATRHTTPHNIFLFLTQMVKKKKESERPE